MPIERSIHWIACIGTRGPSVLVAIGMVVLMTSGSARAQSGGAPPADSLTLEGVVERVLSTHPAIEAARRSVDAASARIGQAKSAYWPRVDAVASYRRQDPVPEISVPGTTPTPGSAGRDVGIQPNNLYDGHVEATQPLYTFGRTSARVDQAKAGRTTAERRVRLERSDLAFEAIQAFYTTLLANARLRVQEEQIAQLERTLDVVERQQAAGTATEFEIQSTRTRLSAARSTRTLFRSQRRRQLAELRRLLGVDAGAPVPLRGSLRETETRSTLAGADTLTVAAARHPSVQVARAQAQAARRAVEAADRSDAPQLALSAQGGIKNGYPGDLNEPRLNESIGLSLQVPLFEGFATQRQVEEAEAEVAAAEARLADVRRQVQTRIEQATADLRARLDQLETTSLRVEQAQSAAELARTRYDAGTITNLDLLEAETELQRARLEETEVRYEVIMGRYALRRAAGTLLPFDAPR